MIAMEFNWGSKKKLKGSKMKLTMISGIHKKKKEIKKYIYIYIFSKDQSAWDGWMDGWMGEESHRRCC